MLARTGFVGLLVALLLAACAAPADTGYVPADTTIDPYARLRAQADEYYRQGVDLYRRGDYVRALEVLQRAKLHDPSPRPDIDELIRRARAEIASGGPAPAATAPAAVTPSPSSRASLFVSRIYGYAITVPAGWRAAGVTERPGSTRLDLFLDESQTGANAFVFAFAPAPGSSQDALIRQSLALRQKPGTQYKRLGVRPVGDTQALIVLYAEQRDDGVWQAVRQAVFMQGGTGWVVAVAAPTAEATSYEPVLDLMLDGFRLTAAQQP